MKNCMPDTNERLQPAEHAVGMETGAIVGVTVQGADQGDTTTIAETVTAAAEDLEAVAAATDGQTVVRVAAGEDEFVIFVQAFKDVC
jgi:hypothetical protein